MVWLDVIFKQLFIANLLLLEMGFYLERWQEIEEFEDEAKMLGKYIHDNLLDKKRLDFCMTNMLMPLLQNQYKSAYWALFTNVLDTIQLNRMIKELDNPETFIASSVFLLCRQTILSIRKTVAIGKVASGRVPTTW